MDEQLLILPLSDTKIALAVGCDEEPDLDICDAWQCAARSATEQLGQQATQYDWSALIGPPSIDSGEGAVSLSGDTIVGPFHLKSSEKMLREAVFDPDRPSLRSWRLGNWTPILINGTHSGYKWSVAGSSAARELNRLCGLLSVAWDSCVVVRDSPDLIDWRTYPIPDRVPWQHNVHEDEAKLLRTEQKSVPDWMNDAWNKISQRPKLDDAVMAHHEGLRMGKEHPSLALVAFIASIEAISQLVYRHNKCGECGNYRFVSAKFKEVLRLVVEEEEAEALKKAYDLRSRTVHRGTLHGAELIVGSLGLNIWTPDDAKEFYFKIVYKMRQASRRLLEIALKGDLPSRSRFVPPPNTPGSEQ